MSSAYTTPPMPIRMDSTAVIQIACPATLAAALASFAPTRRDTIAVTASPRPTAIAYSTVIRASVMPTAAMASVPSRETKAMSTTANTDSMSISSIIGMASRPSARLIGPDVYSTSLSRSDSRRNAMLRCQIEGCRVLLFNALFLHW